MTAGALIGPSQVLARIVEASFLSRYHPLVSTRLACLTHPIGAVILALAGGGAASAFAIFHGAGNGILTIARGTLPLAIFGPQNYGYRLGIIGAPARMAQAVAPLAFGLLIDTMGSRILIVSSALSLAALAALCLLRRSRRPVGVRNGREFASSNPRLFEAKPRHGKTTGPDDSAQRFCAMGDHPAAILCGVPGLPVPGRRIVVLRRIAEAEETDQHRSAAGVHRTAQLSSLKCQRRWEIAAMTHDSKPSITRINPPELGTPPGYSQIVDVSAGRIIFIAGQTALDRDGNVVGKDDLPPRRPGVSQSHVALQAGGCTAANLAS